MSNRIRIYTKVTPAELDRIRENKEGNDPGTDLLGYFCVVISF